MLPTLGFFVFFLNLCEDLALNINDLEFLFPHLLQHIAILRQNVLLELFKLRLKHFV